MRTICSIVFLLVIMIRSYGRLLIRTTRAQRMLPTKDIMFSLICLIAFKQLDDENAKSMYSRLNVFVNKINYLDVKQIDDMELIRKFTLSEGRNMIW